MQISPVRGIFIEFVPPLPPVLGPLLRAVKQPKHFDTLLLQPINHYKRRSTDDKLAGTRDPSGASNFWMRKQHIDLALNPFILPNGREGVVLRDVVQLLQPVALRLG